LAVRYGKNKNGKNSNETIVAAIADVSERMTALVHDEIELAKTEVAQKASSLGRGAAAVGVGAVFGYFALIFLLIAIALVIDGIFFNGLTFVWVGFAVVAGLLILLGVGAFLLARKLFKVGAPTPTMAIDEAKKIRDTVTTASANGNGTNAGLIAPNGNGNGHAPVSPATIAAVAAATQAGPEQRPQSQPLPSEPAAGVEPGQPAAGTDSTT
jgi:hypothetical protein